MSNARNRLLQLSAKSVRTKIVEIPDGDSPVKVMVKSPSVAQASKFSDLAKADNASAQARVMAQIIIECCVDVDSGAAVFSDADVDVILACPSDGWVSVLVGAATELMSAAETTAKN